MTVTRKKLIEVARALEAINAASAREKSIHKARRPPSRPRTFAPTGMNLDMAGLKAAA
ncbi:MAG: hypothetical protein HY875_17740 [Chloroflexi bacterium]|nr:hypothetical protein [Chloroflexota bacterium]